MEWPQGTNELQVNGEGLRAEGGWCESLAARLAGNSPHRLGR